MLKKLIHKFWSIVYRFRYGKHSKIYRIHKILKPLFDEGRIRIMSSDELEKQMMEYRPEFRPIPMSEEDAKFEKLYKDIMEYHKKGPSK